MGDLLDFGQLFKAIFVKVSKSIIFLVKSFLGNFYRHLAIFSGHTVDKYDRFFPKDKSKDLASPSCSVISGQSYKASTIINYDSRVVNYKRKLFIRLATGLAKFHHFDEIFKILDHLLRA